MINNLLETRTVVAPTDDALVRRQLRDLDQPAVYFGEGPAERRERLTKLLAQLSPEERAKLQQLTNDSAKAIKDRDREQAFYYEGSEALREARYKIADFSIRQCNCRLDMARVDQLESSSTRLLAQQELIEKIRHFDDPELYLDEETSSTELKRMMSCNFNRDATMLCTACKSGKCKIWSVPDMDTHTVLRGHQNIANFIVFSPKSGAPDLTPNAANLASCSTDGSILLWNLVDESPKSQLSGRQPWHVYRVRYHPCGQYLASCCSDKSWRLWDLETETEILHQEGHSDSVSDIAFHPDGSLVASAGLDTYARVWDLRTGRSLQLFEGHAQGIKTIDFSPDGYHIATGSLDNSVKIWNLRQRKLEYTIPAHVNAVTTVIFEKENGYYLATASLDKTVKFWSGHTWSPLKTLEAYDDSVTRIDVSPNSDMLISCYSRYLKLWTNAIK